MNTYLYVQGQVGSGQEGRNQIGGIHWEGWVHGLTGLTGLTLQPPSWAWYVSIGQAVKGFKIEVKPELTDISKTKTGGKFKWELFENLKWNFTNHKTQDSTLAGFTYTALKDHDVTEQRSQAVHGMISDELLLYAQDARMAADFNGIAVQDTVAEITVQSLWPDLCEKIGNKLHSATWHEHNHWGLMNLLWWVQSWWALGAQKLASVPSMDHILKLGYFHHFQTGVGVLKSWIREFECDV